MNRAGNKKQKAHRLGHWAETRAAIALMLKGYKIIEMRHKTKLGEIDIIARRGDLIAIVEVKARKSTQAAVDAVTYSAKRRISNASDLWLAKQRDANTLSIRYDIMAVCPWRWPVHLEDAF